MPGLCLKYNLAFEDLYQASGLNKLHAAFGHFLQEKDTHLWRQYQDILLNPGQSTKNESDLRIKLARVLEDFLVDLFSIPIAHAALSNSFLALAEIPLCKTQFLRRRVLNKSVDIDWVTVDIQQVQFDLKAFLKTDEITDFIFAKQVNAWMETSEQHQDQLKCAALYAAWALLSRDGKRQHYKSALFQLPDALDFNNLVKPESPSVEPREGFDLTDTGCTKAHAIDQAHYCLKCHKRDKDSCRTGLKEPADPHTFQTNPLGNTLTGCPLDQKISEMALLIEEGAPLGALAMVVVDNPMVAGTGHRICNDCEKACLFQKQDPVEVPQMETRLLKDVLALPWGFEIYSLLTRWNPLNFENPLPLPATGFKVLVVGMGPAGYTLAHYLLNQGHQVMGVDGAKIEPLPKTLISLLPIQHIFEHFEPLSTRINAGFGGVAEYGITSRWEKNFLLVIRLLLERRQNFKLCGGVFFGGTLTIEQAFEMGFDHIALAMGAGKPKIQLLKNVLAPGVRSAADFLMALQLTGVAQRASVANLVLRLPAIVIGGGLTAVDTATEALAYYPIQVEKFLSRYETLTAHFGEEHVHQNWSALDKIIATEFLSHARALRQAATAKEKLALLQLWGGVTLLYRKSIQASPSYRLNHREVQHALKEGITLQVTSALKKIHVESDPAHAGWISEIVYEDTTTGAAVTTPVKSLLMATGTSANTTLADLDPDNLTVDNNFFQFYDAAGNTTQPSRHNFIVGFGLNDKKISALGDLHPEYYGSVVKAMASAKHLAPQISKWLKHTEPATDADFLSRTQQALTPELVQVETGKHGQIRLHIKAPQAARNHKPGTFFKVQNHARSAPIKQGSRLAMEGVALVAQELNAATGTLIFDVYDQGGSTHIAQSFKAGDPLFLMGPTGTPEKDPRAYSISAPMQCMMQGICAQCMEIVKDPNTGVSKIVYACAEPKQDKEVVDLSVEKGRLLQNSVQEKLTVLWIKLIEA